MNTQVSEIVPLLFYVGLFGKYLSIHFLCMTLSENIKTMTNWSSISLLFVILGANKLLSMEI